MWISFIASRAHATIPDPMAEALAGNGGRKEAASFFLAGEKQPGFGLKGGVGSEEEWCEAESSSAPCA